MDPVTPTDEQLLISARRDPESFGVLFDRTHGDLFGYFMRRTADLQVAADLASEVFAAAFVGRRRFMAQGNGSARAWIYGIAQRQLSRYVRRQRVPEKYRKKLGAQRLGCSEGAARVRVSRGLTRLAEVMAR